MGGHNIYIPRIEQFLYSYTFYVDAIGTSSIAIHQLTSIGKIKINYGDGTSEILLDKDGSISHPFPAAGTYQVTIYHNNNISYVNTSSNTGINTTFDISDGNFPQSAVHFYNDPRCLLTGSWTDFPSIMVKLDMTQGRSGSSIIGDVTDLPTSLEYLAVQTYFKLTGDLGNLPTGLTYYYNNSSTTTLTGDPADLPSGLTYFHQQGTNQINGDIADFPSDITHLVVETGNTLYGNLINLPIGLIYLSIGGSNTVSGNLEDLPDGITYLGIGGSNTISGDFSNLNSNITRLSILGSNTISDDITNIPSSCTYIHIAGSNTVYGNLSNLKPSTTLLMIYGSNTITGDISYLGSGTIDVQGNNTISGDLADMNSCGTFRIYGSNTITGDISNIKATIYFDVRGNNTISGDIADLPEKTYQYWIIMGDNTIYGDLANLVHRNIILNPNRIENYSGKTWASPWYRLEIPSESGYGLSETEVDNLLIDLADDVTSWSSPRTIDLTGGHAARTSASDTAVTTLQGRGVTVNTN